MSDFIVVIYLLIYFLRSFYNSVLLFFFLVVIGVIGYLYYLPIFMYLFLFHLSNSF